jgi:hypothetical protein
MTTNTYTPDQIAANRLLAIVIIVVLFAAMVWGIIAWKETAMAEWRQSCVENGGTITEYWSGPPACVGLKK